MGNTYNVIAPTEKLNRMLQDFRSLRVIEKFEPNDWSVTLPHTDDDEFTDWCEDNEVQCKFVG